MWEGKACTQGSTPLTFFAPLNNARYYGTTRWRPLGQQRGLIQTSMQPQPREPTRPATPQTTRNYPSLRGAPTLCRSKHLTHLLRHLSLAPPSSPSPTWKCPSALRLLRPLPPSPFCPVSISRGSPSRSRSSGVRAP